jgi:aminoglycoside phosphotransferase
METLAVPGTPADETDAPAERVLAVLGRGLAALHSLAVADCPFDESLPVRLARAQEALERDEVDPARFEPRNRHTAPRTLLARIAANPARQDAVVVAHGDASLSNLIVGPDGILGFIDCGHAGRADRYLDLAVAGAEIAGHFGTAALPMLTRAYGLRRWNKRKAAYYEDLYEFF